MSIGLTPLPHFKLFFTPVGLGLRPPPLCAPDKMLLESLIILLAFARLMVSHLSKGKTGTCQDI